MTFPQMAQKLTRSSTKPLERQKECLQLKEEKERVHNRDSRNKSGFAFFEGSCKTSLLCPSPAIGSCISKSPDMQASPVGVTSQCRPPEPRNVHRQPLLQLPTSTGGGLPQAANTDEHGTNTQHFRTSRCYLVLSAQPNTPQNSNTQVSHPPVSSPSK